MHMAVISEEYCRQTESKLTVRKTSLYTQGDGYAVYDNDHCTLAFRVDIYPSVSGELVLMDPNGKPILTIRRKRASLHNRWEGFLGEKVDGQNKKPLFTVRRSTIFGGNRTGMVIEVHGAAAIGTDYLFEGSFSQRSCKVLLPGKEGAVVAEIKRKVDAEMRVVQGKDVFSLLIAPHVDVAFAMGVVLMLDQVCRHHPEGSSEGSVHAEDHLIGIRDDLPTETTPAIDRFETKNRILNKDLAEFSDNSYNSSNQAPNSPIPQFDQLRLKQILLSMPESNAKHEISSLLGIPDHEISPISLNQPKPKTENLENRKAMPIKQSKVWVRKTNQKEENNKEKTLNQFNEKRQSEEKEPDNRPGFLKATNSGSIKADKTIDRHHNNHLADKIDGTVAMREATESQSEEMMRARFVNEKASESSFSKFQTNGPSPAEGNMAEGSAQEEAELEDIDYD